MIETIRDLVLKMGKSLNQREMERYPDLEQDAMRLWFLLDLICGDDEIARSNLIKILDEKINSVCEIHVGLFCV